MYLDHLCRVKRGRVSKMGSEALSGLDVEFLNSNKSDILIILGYR